ncbi:hypothetical protein PybrP1_013028 [[Pythium] brassicae (nom. inval.)]|nr:hypothetical protein PybrP1_013028 [[Pythium] brassicae (nom. inval.)]
MQRQESTQSLESQRKHEHDERQRAWFAAAEKGDVAVMARLLERDPALVDAFARKQDAARSVATALQTCVWRNDCAAAEWLLTVGGASVELPDEHGLTPLLLDITRVTIQQMRSRYLPRSSAVGQRVSLETTKPKRRAPKNRSRFADIDTRIFEALLARNANVHHRSHQVGETALLMAVDEGLIKHVRLLLDRHADPHDRDASGRTLLEVAAESGFTDVAAELLSRAPDFVKIAGERALCGAIRSDFAETVELLLPYVTAQLALGPRLAVCGQLLHLAIEYGATESARVLLANGATIDWRDPSANGLTPLHRASTQRDAALMAFLLAEGADGNARRTGDGFSLYHIALEHCHHDERELRDREWELREREQPNAQWGQFPVEGDEDLQFPHVAQVPQLQFDHPLDPDPEQEQQQREQDHDPQQRQPLDHLPFHQRRRRPRELVPRDRRRDRGSDQLELLAQHGVDINLCDQNLRSPLTFAAVIGCSFRTMAVLVDSGAHFSFPTSSSRDQIAPVLVAWLHDVARASIPHLLETTLSARDFVLPDSHRRVVSALVWTRHSEEALLVLLLALFSPRRRPALVTLRVIELWADRSGANGVVRKLLREALSWRE